MAKVSKSLFLLRSVVGLLRSGAQQVWALLAACGWPWVAGGGWLAAQINTHSPTHPRSIYTVLMGIMFGLMEGAGEAGGSWAAQETAEFGILPASQPENFRG